MTGNYGSEDRALARVNVLRQLGIWPGIVTHPDESCSLTFDPPFILRGGL